MTVASSSPTRSNSAPWAVALGFAALVLVWTRLVGLDTSLVQDEAYTVERFVEGGPVAILTGQYQLNNHPLFSLLTWATTRVLGGSEPVYRLWSVLPAIAAVLVLVWWCRRRLGPLAAVTFAVLAVASPVALSLGVQARGYGLGFLSVALMLVFADRFARTGAWGALAGFAAAAVVGTCTYPLVVLPFFGVAGALVWRGDLRRRGLWAIAAVLVATAAFYAPVLDDIVGRIGRGGSSVERAPGAGQLASTSGAASSARIAAPRVPLEPAKPPAETYRLSWYELPVAWLGIVTPTVELIATGRQTGLCPARCYTLRELVAYGAIPVALVVVGVLALWRRRERTLLALLTMSLAATYLVLWATQVFVLDRYHSFLLLPASVLMAAGLAAVVEPLRTRPRWRAAGMLALSALAVLGAFRIVVLAERWRELPVEDFKRVGEVVRATGVGRVVTNSRQPTGLQHYLGATGVVLPDPPRLTGELCAGSGPLVYVDHRFRSPPLPAPAAQCLARRGGVPVRVPQRRRGDFVVWIVPARRAAADPQTGTSRRRARG